MVKLGFLFAAIGVAGVVWQNIKLFKLYDEYRSKKIDDAVFNTSEYEALRTRGAFSCLLLAGGYVAFLSWAW